jgi:long-chain acyl-CoA synthetase
VIPPEEASPDVLEPDPSPYAARPWLASYPAGVPADFAFPEVPLTRLLDDAAASFPTRTALAFLGLTMTYRELRDAADHLASGLAGLGVRKGDRVSVVLPNCPQNVLTVFAVLRLGGVVVQHNPLSTADELRAQLADCGARVVVCLDRVHDTVVAVRAETSVQAVVVTSVADYVPARTRLKTRLPLPSARRARDRLSASLRPDASTVPFLRLVKTPTAARQTPVDPRRDPALLQYTGGTTGTPRAAVLTHDNLVSNAYMNRLWDTGGTAGGEVTIGVLPLFHAYGMTVCLNATVLLAGTLVLLPRFDVDELFATIDRWRPTMLPAVPTVFRAMTEGPQPRLHDLSSLRVCVSGAMRLPPDVQEQFERLSGALLVEGYGLTETSPSTHCNPLSEQRRPGTIGLPLPGTQCRVVDPDDASRDVPVGSAGELLIRGPQVFQGYWGSDERPVTDDGWLLTGDLVVMDPDGFFTVVDRKKDVIISGGFNVFPSEVEDALAALPGVVDCVVVGVPDRYLGERVKAYVVRTPGHALTEEDAVAHCAALVAAYKVPRTVEFRDELPRTPVGKVRRRQLVDEELAAQTPEDRSRKSTRPDGR